MFITLQNLGIRNPHTTQPGRLARGRGSSRQWSHLKEDPRAGSPGSCVRDASPLQCWAESLSSCLAGGCPEFLGCLQWLMASSMSSIHMREQDRARRKSQSFCNLISDVTFCPFHHILLIRGASPQVTQMAKNLPADFFPVGDPGLFPGWGRSPGGGDGNPLQCSCLENPMARGAWRAAVQGVAKSWTRLSD